MICSEQEDGESLHILQHALGLDEHGRGSSYRNDYVATEGSADYAGCMAHVEAGRMERHGPSALYGGPASYCFLVTAAGKAYVRKHSQPPPKLTRSQRRYRQWLSADTGQTFGDWLRGGNDSGKAVQL